MSWTVEEYERYKARRAAAVDSRVAVSAADVEPSTCDAPLAEKTAPRLNGPVGVVFVSYRHRLTDADGLCGKLVLDGLVSCGILEDDSPEYVESVTHRQVKIPTGEKERTVIELREEGCK